MWDMRLVAVTSVVFELRYNIVVRLAIRLFCDGFLYENMAVWLNVETEDLFSFWVIHSMC